VALRHHNDGGITIGVGPNGAANSDLRLLETVLGALTGSVQEKYDGPLLVSRPVHRNVDLIAIGNIGYRRCSIQETCFMLLGR
jgi:hypothetical protein